MTLEDYYINVYGAGFSGDDLREPLYYVPEDSGGSGGQVLHIFEWGYGKAVEARPEQLRYSSASAIAMGTREFSNLSLDTSLSGARHRSRTCSM